MWYSFLYYNFIDKIAIYFFRNFLCSIQKIHDLSDLFSKFLNVLLDFNYAIAIGNL